MLAITTASAKRFLLALTVLAGVAASSVFFASHATQAQPVETAAEAAATEGAAAVEEAEDYIKAADLIEYGRPARVNMRSESVLIVDDREGVPLFKRRVDERRPIASLTKLMTAIVILESGLALDDTIEITRADRDRLRGTGSRLPYGGVFTRHDLLLAALGASDNRAAAALARTYPGGAPAFVAAMNAKARALGMTRTRFADSSGLHSGNVSTATDLVALARAASEIEPIRVMSTTPRFSAMNYKTRRPIAFHNTNRLVRGGRWEIGLSKTGYTADAGNCLVMQATINHRPVTMVLLDSQGKLSKYGDAKRVRDWLIGTERRVPEQTAHADGG